MARKKRTVAPVAPDDRGPEHAATFNEVGRLGFGMNLFLQMSAGKKERSNRSWVFIYKRARPGSDEKIKSTSVGLGPYPEVTLDEARAKAKVMRDQLRDGIDPKTAKDADRAERRAAEALRIAQTITFEMATKGYFDAHSDEWRNEKHRKQVWSSLETYAFPTLRSLAVRDITQQLVFRVLDPIWKKKTETASRVRGRIEAVLDWAQAKDYRPRDVPNPAAWKMLKFELSKRSKITKVKHHAAIPFDELPALMADIAQRDGVAAAALRFTVLTAARTGEVIGARWPEIDLDKAVWTVPADRMKANVEHRVPLSEPALAILRSLPREKGNDHVFIGGKRGMGLSNMGMSMLLQKRMDRPDLTVHGMRSTFRDWCAERTNFPRELAESALAHTLTNKVEAAYRRGDALEKRAKLMAAWATFCTTPRPAGSVAMLRSA